MAITFHEFQSKAAEVDVHPESTERPWEYTLTGLIAATGRLARILETELPKAPLSIDKREKAMESFWKSLWFLSVAGRFAGVPLEEAAQRGLSALDSIGDNFLPEHDG
jgi:hypothetical protein